MKTDNIDSQFKKVVAGNPDYYSRFAENAKAAVWEKVQSNTLNKNINWIIYLLAAACMGFIALSTVLGIKLYNSNSNTVLSNFCSINLTTERLSNKHETFKVKKPEHNKMTIDTIIICKKEIVYEQVEKLCYKTDTVIYTEIVYVTNDTNNNSFDEESAPKISENETPLSVPLESKYIYFTKDNSETKSKARKFRFRFGSNSSEVNSGTLAISTKL